MALAHSPSIVTSGLVLCLDAGNTKSYNAGISTTAWTDLSGNTGISTLRNGASYNSANGGFIDLDGVNDFVSVPTTSLYDFTSSRITIEVWLKINALPTNSYEVVTSDQSNDPTSWSLGFTKPTEGDVFVFMPSYLGSSVRNTSPRMATSSFPVNAWTHVVATSAGNGDVGRMWVNGVKQIDGTSTTLGLSYDAGRDIGIGLEPTTFRYPLNGSIAVVRIYKDKAFVEAEVQQNFNALRGRFGI